MNLKNTLKKYLIYTPLLLSTFSSPNYSQEREEKIKENFDNNIVTKDYIKEDVLKWRITDDRLEAKDFDKSFEDEISWGFTKFYIIDSVYNMKKDNISLEINTEKTEWLGLDGVVMGLGDPSLSKNGTFYFLSIINNSNITPTIGGQFTIGKMSPGLGTGYFGAQTYIIPLGEKILNIKFSHAQDGYHLFINNREDIDINEAITRFTPNFEGYPFIGIYDSQPDENIVTYSYFDNFKLEKDIITKIEGFGANIGREINPNEIPKRFIRGDSNMDLKHNILDAITTLEYSFKNISLKCPDSADVNDDGEIDLQDIILSLWSLYIDTNIKIPAPNIITKDNNIFNTNLENLIMDAGEGIDTTPDNLKCE